VPDMRGLCDGRIRFNTQFIGGVAVGAKKEALCPGRVPHVPQSVHGPKRILQMLLVAVLPV
jgi:hypothetical protein